MEKSAQQHQSNFGKLKNYFTNSMFHLGGLGRFFGSGNLPETITVLGEKLPRDKGMQLFRKIIWLTYRTEFPCINGQLLTDAGWGCMIRVGQMLMAQALRRHSGAENQDDLTNIVSAFLDDDEERKSCFNYSIQKVVKQCELQFGLRAGSWLSVCHISFTLKALHTMRPLRGFDTLKVQVNNNSALFYEQLLNVLGMDLCNCRRELSPERFICPQCHVDKGDAILLVLISRLGVQKPSEKYRPMLTAVMGLKQSLGIIGGKPGKALYLVGMDGDEFSYLDPHFVQPSSNRKNMEILLPTYFCDSYRTIKYEQLDPSVGLGFYISGTADLQQFLLEMEAIKKKFGKEFFIYTDLQCPEYVKKEEEEFGSNHLYVGQNRKSGDMEFTNSFEFCPSSLE